MKKFLKITHKKILWQKFDIEIKDKTVKSIKFKTNNKYFKNKDPLTIILIFLFKHKIPRKYGIILWIKIQEICINNQKKYEKSIKIQKKVKLLLKKRT